MTSDGGGSSRRRPWRASRRRAPARRAAASRPVAKPGAACLGVDLATLDWQRSGIGEGSLEVAFVRGPGRSSWRTSRCRRENAVQWVLLRIAGDPSGRVLVYDRAEWLNFLDGASRGEFDWAVELSGFHDPVEFFAPQASNSTRRSARAVSGGQPARSAGHFAPFDQAITGQNVSAVR